MAFDWCHLIDLLRVLPTISIYFGRGRVSRTSEIAAPRLVCLQQLILMKQRAITVGNQVRVTRQIGTILAKSIYRVWCFILYCLMSMICYVQLKSDSPYSYEEDYTLFPKSHLQPGYSLKHVCLTKLLSWVAFQHDEIEIWHVVDQNIRTQSPSLNINMLTLKSNL